jgi:hypothetical protein
MCVLPKGFGLEEVRLSHQIVKALAEVWTHPFKL